MSNFLFLHPGARAHYLLPRALAKIGRLKVLITDTWISPNKLDQLFFLPRNIREKLKGRYHEDLQSVEVVDIGWKGLWFEYRLRKKYPSYGWLQVISRDNYVKKATLTLLHSCLKKDDTLIGLAYTSLDAFQAAKKLGAKTILYQMDPAKSEEDYIDEVIQQGRYVTKWERAPAIYWENWREECALADIILVNSEWSKQGLIKEGILEDKIKIFPLPIEIRSSHLQFVRIYPDEYTQERPLRLLFLGTLMIRKGIHVVLEAAQQLKDLPVEFILVGRSEIEPQIYNHLTNVRYEGEVSRAQVDDYYKKADIFLFPTLSDGFGLTQLEAMAWKLPVINTLHCAQVVTEEAGWTLPPDSPDNLVKVIQNVLDYPSQLNMKSRFAFKQADLYNINTFASSFVSLL
jgi:glycosyltransferase involved in cell wall biosynthesis